MTPPFFYSDLQVNVRTRDNVVHGTKAIPDFLSELRSEVAAYH